MGCCQDVKFASTETFDRDENVVLNPNLVFFAFLQTKCDKVD